MLNTLDLENKIKEFMSKHHMLDNVEHVCVATSGGADSMVLLTFLSKYSKELNIKVSAVHVNHGIRGESARKDAMHVKEYCESNKIDFVLFDAEKDGTKVPEHASEEWARELRYGYFESVLNEEGCVIATAHTLSDQAETMIFRLARGTGLKGLCGIPVIREGFIRPVMCITRNEIEYLASEYKVNFVTDETNLGDDYARNKIRHNVIPVLKMINESSEKSMSKTCERVSNAMSFIEQAAHEALQRAVVIPGHSFDSKKFNEAHNTLQEYMAMEILSNTEEVKESSIDLMLSLVHKVSEYNTDNEQHIGTFEVSATVKIVVTNKYITVCRDISVDEPVKQGKSKYGLYGYQFNIEEIGRNQFITECIDKRQLAFYADASKLAGMTLEVMSRKESDKFKPAKRMGKKLKGFITELKIPLADRDILPVIRNRDTQEIIWVWGLGFTDGFTPTEDTVNIIKVR